MTTKEKLDAYAVGKMRDLLKRANNPTFAHFGPTPPAWDRSVPDKVDGMTDEEVVRVFNEAQSAPPEPAPGCALSDFLLDVRQRADDLRREAALAQGLLLNRDKPSSWMECAERALEYHLTSHEQMEGQSAPDGEAEMLCDARAAAANQLCEMWWRKNGLLEGLTEADALAVACLMVDSALIPGFVVRTVNHANGKLVGNRLYAGRKGLNRNLALLLQGMARGLEVNGREEEAAAFRAASTKAGGGGYQPGDVWVVGDREFRILQVRETSWALPRRAETQRSS